MFNEFTDSFIKYALFVSVLFFLTILISSDSTEKLTDERYPEKSFLFILAELPVLIIFAFISFVSGFYTSAGVLIVPVGIIWLFRAFMISSLCKKIKYSKIKYWIVQFLAAAVFIGGPQIIMKVMVIVE